ncbi:MAG: HIT family protein [Firmicutes bacterium]|uniref:HIT family protein n=1 Tax=Candidatus Scatoplasma merdavium TaxID=2840932 RepID=A0A9D9GLW8_9BACL|nr:HIT family protein [Candidatus Scatoplasma merdavium]
MNKEENCVFCNIAEGKIPSAKVYEDDKILAFLDVSPTSKGHTLVITKEHFANFLMVPKDLLAQAFDVAQKIGQAMVANLGAKGINILTNVNEIAGQSVMHFHIHVIPRYDESDGLSISFKPAEISKYNPPAIASEIKKGL